MPRERERYSKLGAVGCSYSRSLLEVKDCIPDLRIWDARATIVTMCGSGAPADAKRIDPGLV